MTLTEKIESALDKLSELAIANEQEREMTKDLRRILESVLAENQEQ